MVTGYKRVAMAQLLLSYNPFSIEKSLQTTRWSLVNSFIAPNHEMVTGENQAAAAAAAEAAADCQTTRWSLE
jgi:hypothetical protein